jgi:prostamide/prostaglandin F2alpha synthase
MGLLGTSRRRQSVDPPRDAGELGAVVVRDLDDRAVRLGTLWEEVPAVLVFLRHYG